MRLYIAEKPSLGRAIADVLPKPHEKGDGYVRAANGDVVSWCIGHLLEQVEPEQYDPALKRWQWDTLPIVPEQWKLAPRAACRGQLAVLRRWLKEADEIVHAGDPDREGQLLVDEVVAYLDVPKSRRDAMRRCLISDLNPPAVRRSLAQMRSNREFLALSVSALARSRADASPACSSENAPCSIFWLRPRAKLSSTASTSSPLANARRARANSAARQLSAWAFSC